MVFRDLYKFLFELKMKPIYEYKYRISFFVELTNVSGLFTMVDCGKVINHFEFIQNTQTQILKIGTRTFMYLQY